MSQSRMQVVWPILRTKILDFGGFDSSMTLVLWGGILTPIGDFPESLSQRISVEIISVGILGVGRDRHSHTHQAKQIRNNTKYTTNKQATKHAHNTNN